MNHNSGEPYRPVYPSDERVIGGILPSTETHENRGLYSRADIDKDMEVLARLLVNEDPAASLEDYQYWAEGNWKTVHGTFDSVERFSNKLNEEHHEALEAYEDLRHISRHDEAGRIVASESLSSELGDVLWCFTALASNGGASLDTGVRVYLHKYVLGTQIIKGNMPHPPKWREAASKISTKWAKITLADIHEIVETGFEPAPSAVMNIFDDDPPEYEVDYHLRILLGGIVLGAATTQADIQYGRRDMQGNPSDVLVGQGYFESVAMRLSEITAAAIFETAYIAKTELGQSLTNIVSANVAKLTDRVREGKIDKSDAPRG